MSAHLAAKKPAPPPTNTLPSGASFDRFTARCRHLLGFFGIGGRVPITLACRGIGDLGLNVAQRLGESVLYRVTRGGDAAGGAIADHADRISGRAARTRDTATGDAALEHGVGDLVPLDFVGPVCAS